MTLYTVEVDECVVSIRNKLTNEIPFSLACEDIDSFENLLTEVTSVCDELNKKWEQVQLFVKFNKELTLRNMNYAKELEKNRLYNEELRQFKDIVFVLINEMIETSNHHRKPIKSIDYGDDLGYWNGVYQKLKELRDILENEPTREVK